MNTTGVVNEPSAVGATQDFLLTSWGDYSSSPKMTQLSTKKSSFADTTEYSSPIKSKFSMSKQI